MRIDRQVTRLEKCIAKKLKTPSQEQELQDKALNSLRTIFSLPLLGRDFPNIRCAINLLRSVLQWYSKIELCHEYVRSEELNSFLLR